MKKIFTILILSSLFAGELEVDGDLTVTGNIQAGTIDSLEQRILVLEEQIVSLQIIIAYYSCKFFCNIDILMRINLNDLR